MKSRTALLTLALFVATALTIAFPLNASAAYLGPTEYLCFDSSTIAGCTGKDSPFAGGSYGYFFLENFEDHLLNTPGVSVNQGFVTSVGFSSIHDSVDGDDGVIDGSGLDGDSYFGDGSTGLKFTFDALALGNLPTDAGIVWTDGAGQVFFEAFDQNGNSLGVVGPSNNPDGSVNGETAEDRFFGVQNAGGISSIFIRNTAGGIEADHLQYGRAGISNSVVPEPASMLLFGLGSLGLQAFRRKKIV